MNTLTRKTNPITKTLYISLFSTSSSSSISSSSRRYEEESSRNVRVSVWWDIENCSVPNGINVFKITNSITSALRINSIKGPIQITAFGDIFSINRLNQEALSSSGVNLVHVPNGGKNNADRSLLVDLMYWVSQNPPPAHVFLISGDSDFAGILHKLRMNNYNILLAAREANQSHGVLYSAASIMWHWSELAKGENLSGKHFNQPPDGPYNSWYGHFRGPLEDPFGMSQPQKQVEVDDLSNAEQSSELRYRPIPIAVLRQLRHIVHSHREGLTIKEVRVQLLKSKVMIDKDLYGYKKFSCFLQSLPHIIKVESSPDGKLFLKPASTEIPKNDKSHEIPATITRMVDMERQISLSIDENGKIVQRKPAEEFVEKTKTVLDASASGNEVDFFKERHKETNQTILKAEIVENMEDDISKELPSSESAGKSINEKQMESSNQNDDLSSAHSSSNNTDLNLVAELEVIEKPEAKPGFIGKIINWCKFWENESSSDKHLNKEPNPIEEDTRKSDDPPCTAKLDEVVSAPQSRKHELFAKETFWNALCSFFKTHRGSDMVLKSMSRFELAERLQKEGPLFLQPLQAIDIRDLVELLLREKKWIKEFPNKKPRFRIVHLSEESSASTQPHNPTELKVTSTVNKNPSENPRNKLLADCQKLVDEVLSHNPDGFNMSILKKEFRTKFGYALDHQKFGYPKLADILKMMRGVKLMNTRVLPDNNADFPWEELGPVTKSNLSKDGAKSSQDKMNAVYELSTSEDDNREKEEQSSSKVKVVDEEDSSLMKILDSWYPNKDETRDDASDPETRLSSSEDEATANGNNGCKQKPQKSYTFIAESSDVKKDKLLDGILGSLKESRR